ncbi:MAG: DNA mismatch repair endonuclease MutL, partial [Candidatus Sericytochromatia bacterium]
MAKIHRLPLHVANQIAAGEVIERPASVVKELVENAIDAGARRITVEVSQGGRQLRITDDGSGMSEADAVMAFERFATSKIQDADQLWNLATMGFRGEALASIASIAKVECLTRERGGDRGTQVTIHGGSEPVVKPAGCPEGTTIQVTDLFFNTPARLKFLRAASTEQGHIADVLTSLALCHPEVDFRLVVNDRETLSTVGARTLKEVASALLGDETGEGLATVDYANPLGRVHGLVALPHKVRGDRSRQWFFINKRWVKHPLLAKGVEEAYVGHIPSDRHPVFLLFVDIDPALVDINVHPAKKEVRLGQTHGVYTLIKEGVIRAFTQADLLPSLPEPFEPLSAPAWYPPAPGWTPPDRPIHTAAAMAAYQPAERIETPGLFAEPPAPSYGGGLPRELDGLKVIAQLHRTYIMCEH